MVSKLRLSEDEWKQRLSPEEFRVLRKHGSEPARRAAVCFRRRDSSKSLHFGFVV
jgi:hypothetical protein